MDGTITQIITEPRMMRKAVRQETNFYLIRITEKPLGGIDNIEELGNTIGDMCLQMISVFS
jgi:hypothetical protein